MGSGALHDALGSEFCGAVQSAGLSGCRTCLREDIDAMMQSRKVDIAGHVATAEYATRYLLSELAENRRYIVTHGDCREAIVSNFDDLLAAHDRAQPD